MRTNLFARTAFVGFCVVSASAGQFHIGSHTFTVPDGFIVEKAAGPPLVERPISADFDENGRLYVTDSSGSNEPVQKQLQEKPHRIVRLEDADGDGRFDHATVFAEHLMFPEGALWYRGSLYVAAPPSIWKFTDSRGEGVADQREEWFDGKTLTGCANDLHGPDAGLDGMIYWCKGAFARQEYPQPNGKTFVTRAAHIFRRRPEGGYVEPVMTGGMDNPVSVAFTADGERLLTGTFFEHPSAGKRDGIIHAIYGGVYGKDHDVLDGHKRTGGLMPVMTQLGPAAACSIIRYRSEAFGKEYRNNLFTCLFNLHKVMRHRLLPRGATFETVDSDFLVADDPDFHPTAVLEDADGSLLVIDTGGWYKICCPTSQLYKPDVLGAIYRIRRAGAPRPDDPRGLKLEWNQASSEALIQRLDDARPAVRDRAMDALARRGANALPALQTALEERNSSFDRITPAAVRRRVVWVLTRIEDSHVRAAVRLALSDPDSSVRHAAAASVSLWRDASAEADLLRLLRGPDPAQERIAAEALGRIGERDAAPALLQALAAPHDRVLEHSLIYALIEINDPTAVAAGLRLAGPRVQRAALIALDQMDRQSLQAETVAPFLVSKNPELQQAAAWVVSHHPEWGGPLASFFAQQLTAVSSAGADQNELAGELGSLARDGAIQDLLARVLDKSSEYSEAARRAALSAMAQSGLNQLPVSWAGALAKIYAQPRSALLEPAVAAARAMPAPKRGAEAFSSALLRLAQDPSRPDSLRLDALSAASGGIDALDDSTFQYLLSRLAPSEPVLTRSAAASALAKAPLSSSQLIALAQAMKTLGPLEVTRLISAFEKKPTAEIGRELLNSLTHSKSVKSLRPEMLQPLLAKYPASVREQGDALLRMIQVDAAQQRARLEELLKELPPGDIRRGQAIFNSPKAACSSCHSIGYLGGHVGPDLTRIGQIRTERDLLESVVYPSASFVRSYEPMIVATKDGEEYNGIVKKDAPDEVWLVTGPATEVHLSRADIVEMRPGSVSIMPAGLADQLSRQELADLLAFLKATRW